MAKSFDSIKAGWSNPKRDELGKKKSFKEIKASDYDFGVDSDYIKSFYEDSQNYLQNSEKEYTDIGYGSKASDVSSKYTSATADLKDRANTIRGYLNSQKSKLKTEYYDTILSYLDNFEKASEDISAAYSRAGDFYSRFENEYDYNAYVMNNTTGTDTNAISARQNAYAANSSRIAELDEAIKNFKFENEGKYEWTTNPNSNTPVLTYKVKVKNQGEYDALVEEKKKLEDENRKYEYFNKENDALFAQYANEEDFSKDSFYSERESAYELRDGDEYSYQTFLDFYNISPELEKHTYEPVGRPDLEEEKIADEYYNAASLHGWNYATDEEFRMLNFLANTQGDEAAQEYFKSLSIELDKRRTESKDAEEDKKYANAEWYEKAGMNIMSVPENLIGQLYSGTDAVFGMLTDSYNPYSAVGDFTRTAQNTRENIGNDLDILTNNDEFLGITLGDAYQSAMSGVDSIVGALTFGKGYTVLMGMGAASSTAKDLYERGASKEQIALGGILAGAAEVAFEKISIDYFLDNFIKSPTQNLGQWILKSLTQGGIELSEEMATEIANTISDVIVMGSQSDWEQLLEQYKKLGYSDGEAISKALMEIGGNVWESGIGGFISGTLMGGGGSSINLIQNRKAVNAQKTELGTSIVSNENVKGLVAAAQGLKNTKSNAKLKTLANRLADVDVSTLSKSGQERFSKKVGELYSAIQEAQRESIGAGLSDTVTSIISEKLKKQGITDESEIKAATEVIIKAVYGGGSLSAADSKILDKVGGKEIVNYLLNNTKEVIAKGNITSSQRWEQLAETAKLTDGKRAGIREINIDEYSLSDDGQTYVKGTSEAVDITGISSIKDGKMTVNLSNGETTSLENVDLGSEEQAIIYEGVLSMGIDAASAQAIVKAFDFNAENGIDATTYILGVEDAIKYGKIGGKAFLDTGVFTSELSENQRRTAYRIGEISAENEVKKDAEKVKTSIKMNKKGELTSGSVAFDGITAKDLNIQQKTTVKVLELLFGNRGINLVFFQSPVNEKGEHIGENGSFDPETNTMRLDINAGMQGKDTILFTASHELTHFIKMWSPEKYKVFADFLTDSYAKHGVPVDVLVQQQIDKAKRGGRIIDEDTAYEEVVADSCESFLRDSKLLDKLIDLAKKDMTLFERTQLYIDNLLADLRKCYKGFKPDSFEGKKTLEMTECIERLHELWEEAAISALDNSQKSGGKIQKNTTDEGGVKLQTRFVNGNQVVWIEENILKENKGLPVHQFIADFIAEHIGDVYTIIESGQKVYIGEDLPNEYTQSKYTQKILRNNPNIVKVKNRASAKLGEMIEIATNRRWEKTKHDTNKDAKYGMYRYDTRFGFPVLNSKKEVVGANIYTAELVIRNASNGKKYLYDIVGIKKDTVSSDWMSKKTTSAAVKSAGQKNNVSTNSILNLNETVKENSVKKSDRDTGGKIAQNMTDSQRSEILRNKSINNIAVVKAIPADILEKAADISSWEDVNNLFGSKKSTLIQKLASEFGVFKSYSNVDINISFEFSKNNFRESYHKQKVNYEHFAKMFSVFDGVVEKAIGVEAHNRNTEGYKTDITLNNVYVLMSAFEDGDYIIPVKLEIKEFKDKKNTLYVAISLQGIKKAEVSKQGNTENGVTQNSRSATISISDLFAKINPKDIDFLKYIPNEFLTDEQIAAKNKAISTVKLSDRDPDAIANYEKISKQLSRENAKLTEDVLNLKELLKLQRTVTHGKTFTKSSLSIVAKRLMSYMNAKGNSAELTGLLNNVYTHIAEGKDVSWESIRDLSQDAVNWLIEHEYRKPQRDAYADDILKHLRTLRISLNEQQKTEVEHIYGGFNEFRKKAIGRVIVANDGVSLDSIWQELSELFPSYFDASINSGDQPSALMNVIDVLQNSYVDEYFYEVEMRTQELFTKIYDAYWDVATLHTVADTKQKEINALKSKHKQQMADLRESHNEHDEKLKQAHRDRISRLRNEYKERSIKKQQEIIEHYRESRKKAIEGRQKTEMRHKIQKVVSELNKLLLRGTKDNHVMIGLQKAVAEALDAVNMDTVTANERVAKYDELIAKATDADTIAVLKESRDRIENIGDRMKSKLDKLKNAYRDIKNSDDPLIANSYDEVISTRIEYIIETVGDTPLRNMSLQQLEDVHDMYQMVLSIIRNSNKAFKTEKAESIASLGNKIISETEEVGGAKKYVHTLTDKAKNFVWTNLKPKSAFNFIGSDTLSKIYDNVRAGEDIWAVDIGEAKAFYEEKTEQYQYDSWDFNKAFSFTSASGIDFELTLEQIMSLYAYSKREQADRHLRYGGFVFDNSIEKYIEKKNGKQSILKYKVNTADAHNLSIDTLGEIISKLTNEQRAFVDDMQDYLSNVMGDKGNEVSLEMYGVKLFKDKHYFPLKSAKQFMFEQNESVGEVRIKNSGFSKETVPKANNPIILDNFTDVWANHVNDMAMYHAFVLPLEDFNRVYNYKTPVSEDMKTQSVKTSLQNAYGTRANHYISQLLKELNGGIVSGNIQNEWMKLFGKFKKASVAASLSTIVQQPTAVIRATAYINPKYFVGKPNINHKNTWAEIKKYAPVAIIKELGGFDIGGGHQATEYITAKKYKGIRDKVKGFFTDSNYRDDIFMLGATKADEVGWNTIWNAVKREVAAEQHLNVGTEEFFKACGKRFTEVVSYTQVYDSVFSRSAIMRDKGDLNKFATSFMGEPTTSVNMLFNAVLRLTRGGDVKQSVRDIGAVYMSIAAAAALASMIYALRDDDEDEAFLEKWAEAFGNKLSSEVWIHNMLPYIRDISSIIEGWDVVRPDMSIIADIKSAFDSIVKIDDGEIEWKIDFADWDSVYGAMENLGGNIAALFGIPARNIMRDVRGIMNGIKMIFDDIEPSGVGEAFVRGVEGEEQSKYDDFLTAVETGKNLKTTIQQYTDNGVKESTLASKITSHFKPLYKEMSNYERAAIKGYLLNAYVLLGYDRADRSKAIDKWLKEE